MFHRFSDRPRKGWASADVFRTQVRHLKRYYTPLTMVELVQGLFEGRSLPANAIVITVDDGYRDFYEIAYPILKEESVPATFFITTGFVNGDLWLWPDQVSWLFGQDFELRDEILLGDVCLRRGAYDEGGRDRVAQSLVARFLVIPDEQKQAEISRLAEALGKNLPEDAPVGYQAATWSQVAEMAANGVEIGGHTVTHPSLGTVDYDRAAWEISRSMADIKRHLGEAPRTFCYPNGMPSDHQDFLPGLVSRAGFSGACVAFPDALGTSLRYGLRRHVGGDNMFQFHKGVSGMEYLGHRLKRSVRLSPEAFSPKFKIT
jgi:peptidoglycan/xylan/chitin deacetylase (PgdA/CDA1 family)